MHKKKRELPLDPYRVLDLTDEKGFLCGKLLGDLGADVIKIEKPGGDPSRRIGPFYKDIPDAERSLYWFAYNSNKRGITLNIETQDGREIFKRLAKTADVIIESFSPGYMEKIGLGYATLSEINPGIIMTSISHFGKTGPYRDYKSCDIINWAISGYLYMCGDIDRPPVLVSNAPQSFMFGGAEAAVGTTIALYCSQQTGEGQWVDVSIHQSVQRLLGQVGPTWELAHQILRRQGSSMITMGLNGATITQPQIWQCKEGMVILLIQGGHIGAATNRALIEWMDEEGMADDFLKNLDWENLDAVELTQEDIDQVSKRIEGFFKKHTAHELYEGAKKKRMMLYPLQNVKDLSENTQLGNRDFWEQVEHPELGTSITYPGAFVKASETPLCIQHRAPLIGEHNSQIYQELGISPKELNILKQANII